MSLGSVVRSMRSSREPRAARGARPTLTPRWRGGESRSPRTAPMLREDMSHPLVSSGRSGVHDHLEAAVLLVEKGVEPEWGIVQAHPVGDDEARVDIAAPDPLQQQPQIALHVTLTGSQ